jgi:hypothetical protein
LVWLWVWMDSAPEFLFLFFLLDFNLIFFFKKKNGDILSILANKKKEKEKEEGEIKKANTVCLNTDFFF